MQRQIPTRIGAIDCVRKPIDQHRLTGVLKRFEEERSFRTGAPKTGGGLGGSARTARSAVPLGPERAPRRIWGRRVSSPGCRKPAFRRFYESMRREPLRTFSVGSSLGATSRAKTRSSSRPGTASRPPSGRKSTGWSTESSE